MKSKNKDNTLVDVCKGCRKKHRTCNCKINNVYSVYTKDIYLRKEIRKIIENGVVSELSGKEIINEIKKVVNNNSTAKQKLFTGVFIIHR